MRKQMDYQQRVSSVETFAILFAILCSLWQLNIYFSWPTYRGGILSSIAGIGWSSIWGILFVLFLGLKSHKIIISQRETVIILSGVFVGISLLILSGLKFDNPNSIGIWVSVLVILVFACLDFSFQARFFNYFTTVMAVIFAIAIIYYVLNFVGIDIPHDILYPSHSLKFQRGYYYIHWPLCLKPVYGIEVMVGSRLTSVFDEPGVVGTLSGLLLAYNGYKLKRNWKLIVIFIAGLLSFSLAFVFLTIIFFICKYYTAGKHKLAIALIIIIVAYIIFENLNFNIPILQTIQNRIHIANYMVSGDNRTNAAFESIFEIFLHEDVFNVLVGKDTEL